MERWDPANNYGMPLPRHDSSPSLFLDPSQDQSLLASFKNGYALDQETGDILSGAEPFLGLLGLEFS